MQRGCRGQQGGRVPRPTHVCHAPTHQLLPVDGGGGEASTSIASATVSVSLTWRGRERSRGQRARDANNWNQMISLRPATAPRDNPEMVETT